MQLTELQHSDKNTYNNFISRSDSGSFLQAWEWGDWQEQLGKIVHRFIIEDEEHAILLAAQIIQATLYFQKYYLYIPYGPILNQNQAAGIKNQALLFFIQQLREKFPDAIFLRIEPTSSELAWPGKKTTNIQPGRTLVVDVSKPLADLLADMHPKTRYNVKIAQKHNVKIEKEFSITSGHGLYFKESLELILETAKRQGYYTHPLSYYQKLMDFFALHHANSNVTVGLYKAIYEKHLLATGIMVDFGNTRTYLFGGSSTEYRNVMAPYLLHFEAMFDAKKKGLHYYDFGGLETSVGKTPEFARFKMGFGGHAVEYAGARDIIQSKPWYTIYIIMRKLNRIFKHL